MKRYQRILTALLAVVLLFSMTACSGKGESWIAKSGEYELIPGEYIMHVMDAYSEAFFKVADPTQPLLKQSIDGMAADQWITQRAIQLSRKHIEVLRLFDELGLTLTEDDNSYITEYADSLWAAYGAEYEKYGVSKTAFAKTAEMNTKLGRIFNHYYTEGGEYAVPEEEIRSYAEENYVRVNFLIFGTEEQFDGDAEAAKKMAQSYIDRLNNGENIYALVTEYESTFLSEEDMAAHLEHDNDAEAALAHDSFLPYEDTSYPESLRELLRSIEVKAPTLYEEEGYFYVVYKQELAESQHFFMQNGITLLQQIKGEEYDAMLEENAKAIQLEANEKEMQKYTVKKLGLG